MSYSNRGRDRQYSNRSNNQRQPFRRSFQPKFRNQGPTIDILRYVNSPVEVRTEEKYQSRHTFADFGLDTQLLSNVLARGYTIPTPIQDQAIPELMSGRDVVGIANTGTGKTAAFLLPLINKVLLNRDQGVLILAPTRELALQIYDEYQEFVINLPLSSALCIGGADIRRQTDRLKGNPHFVIGTPGRIKDLINRGAFNLDLFTNIVLDEVDRMLDIGFRQDIKFLIAQLPEERHAAFFSATMNRETEEIMHSFLTNPVTISVRKTETANNIHQDIVRITSNQNKVDILHELLIQESFEKVIVFGRTKHGINKLEMQLAQRGIRVTSIHGNKSQNARQRSLQDFKQGRVKALLATDVASRGIDIVNVTHVINYDEPTTYEDYVHRIGRTGRAGKGGKALTFVTI
jgi:ATP-dependent RNA helicase RhlE